MTTIQSIPLSKLQPSARNVRKSGGASIEDLAASIAAHGLLQNLSVTAEDGVYQVVAGGRRLSALMKLAGDGVIPADYDVPCLVLTGTAAHEASLAENVVRQAMHPADEFDAFAVLASEGLSAAEISARFGTKPIHVQQRLKLANVAPDILQEYRDGKATLEQMMALSLTDDQAVQLRVWRGARHTYAREPENLRSAIVVDEVSTGSSLGKFVGMAAYEKAGGAMRKDLFSEEDTAYFLDSTLLVQLAEAKLQRTADKVQKEGWAWAEARVRFDYSEQNKFGQAPSAWKGNKQTWTEEAMANAGVVVTIGYNGETKVSRGLVRPEDRAALTKATGKQVEGGRAKPARKPGEFTFAAIQRLQAEANAIVQRELLGKPQTALALLVSQLADSAFYSEYGSDRWVHIRRESSNRPTRSVLLAAQEAPAAQAFKDAETAWREALPAKQEQLLAWALAQDTDKLLQLLAFLVAREVDAIDAYPTKHSRILPLVAAAGVDMAEHWKPTEAWLQSLPRAVILEQVRDAGGKTAVATLEKLKKQQLPAQAIAYYPAGWLPKVLRAPTPKKARAAKAQPAANNEEQAAA